MHLISEKKSKHVKKRQKNLPNVGSENAAKVAGKNLPKRKQFSQVTVSTESYKYPPTHSVV